MAKIMIEIDCKKRFCGHCQLVQFHESETHPFCSYFGGTLPETWNERKNEWNPLKRLPECISAEVPTDVDIDSIKLLHQHLKKSEYPTLTAGEIDYLLSVKQGIENE